MKFIEEQHGKATAAVRELVERYGHEFVALEVERLYALHVTNRDEPDPIAKALSSAPDDVWFRCPLTEDECRRVIACAGLGARPELEEPALLLTFAKTIGLGFGEVLFRPRAASRKQVEEYAHLFSNVVLGWQRIDGFRNSPPKPPGTWLRATIDWATSQSTEAQQAGRPGDVGYDEFFRLILRFYSWAFGRAASATPGGPTYRFCRALWDTLAAKEITPKWWPITERSMLDRIKDNRKIPPLDEGDGVRESEFSPEALYRTFLRAHGV